MTTLLTPGSPTLTNPDMILPYSARSSAAATSSSSDFHRISAHSSNSGSPVSGDDGDENMRRGVRRLFGKAIESRRDGLNPPMQQNETSNRGMKPGEQKNTQHDAFKGHIPPLASSSTSSTLHDSYGHKSSSNAGSDETSNSYWEGFDGPIIEMVADPYVDRNQRSLNGHREPHDMVSTPDHKEQGHRIILDEDENDPNSHAAMSKRAEQILANAKKRLLTMENNLNRARSGLNGRPSSSMSTFIIHDHEPVSLYTIPGMKNSTEGHASSKHRQGDTQLHPGGGKGHSRGASEPTVPSSLHTDSRVEESVSGGMLSSSGPSTLDTGLAQTTPEEPGSSTSRNWFWTGLNRNGGSAGRRNNALEPLQEDEPAPTSFESPSHTGSPHSAEDQPHTQPNQHSSDGSSCDLEKSPANGLTRARSTTQMRDLRDQMQDLKGKISSLKLRAREDSMRRRSLQSLRTPSPFTAAEQWYTGSPGSPGHRLGNTTVVTSSGQRKRSTSFGQTNVTHDNLLELKNGQKNTQPSKSGRNEDITVHDHKERFKSDDDTSFSVVETKRGPMHEDTVQEENVADKPDGDISPADENDGSLDGLLKIEELDSSSPPIGERHEDRPDAFDYEHFYLHSGMGHFARRQDNSRSSSHSSIYSVETAKPFSDIVEDFHSIDDDSYNLHATGSDEHLGSRLQGHIRQSSGESISTLATFATATEGDVDEETDREEWTNGRPMAGSWHSDVPSKRKFHIDSRNGPAPQPVPIDREHNTTKSTPRVEVDAGPAGDQCIPTQPSTRLAAPPPTPRSPIDVLSAFSALKDGAPAQTIQLGHGDKELVERLIQSLSKVCVQLQAGHVEGGKYENRVWRRRLDAARRVLEGEVNGEAF
ncbi:hypothetical protein MMC07_000085 [Pseudocyphellaria aurata]|nr:hypothetical protein [Pseudocyphellaria aurata]